MLLQTQAHFTILDSVISKSPIHFTFLLFMSMRLANGLLNLKLVNTKLVNSNFIHSKFKIHFPLINCKNKNIGKGFGKGPRGLAALKTDDRWAGDVGGQPGRRKI